MTASPSLTSHSRLRALTIALLFAGHEGWAFQSVEPPFNGIGNDRRAHRDAFAKPIISTSMKRDSSLRWLWGGNAPEADDDDAALREVGPVLDQAHKSTDESIIASDDESVRQTLDHGDIHGNVTYVPNQEEEKQASRRYRPKVWARVKGLHRKRRARVVKRKLNIAQKRFEERHSSLSTVSASTLLTEDELDGDGDEFYDECFLLPGWRENELQSSTASSPPADWSMASAASACQDQLPFAHGEIKKMPYVHGGFFGAAPFMLTSPRWTSILRTLMPDVYVQISRRASRAPAPRLIHWAENNPVVAAYGTAHELEFSQEMPILEWDVYLDPQLVRSLKTGLRDKEDFLQRRTDDLGQTGDVQIKKDIDTVSERVGEDIIETSASHTDAVETQNLLDFDDEIKRRTESLVEGMLIAHGNTRQIITEQTGLLRPLIKKLNFASVKRTCKTLGGGMFARQWLAVYSEAMKLGMVDGHVSDEAEVEVSPGGEHETDQIDDTDPFQTNCDTMPRSTMETDEATCLRTASASACPEKSIHESIADLPSPIRLVLDLKSRHVSRRIWALIIDYLRDAGARIEGIASFNVAEMRDTSQYCSTPVNEIFFVHAVGDMQHMLHSGQIKKGDQVFFNAGSLFWDFKNAEFVRSMLRRGSQPHFDKKNNSEGYRLQPYAKMKPKSDDQIQPDTTYGVLERDFMYNEEIDGVSSTIQDYKDYYDLKIGLYVQECGVDEATLNLIVKYVNANSHVYDLGLSWGGINGLTVKGIEPGRFSVTDGLRSQRFVSVPWKKDLSPGSSKTLPPLGFVKKVLFH